ncbi:Lrp/AsnC family transcriptional regulator [Singulisphaera sp. PoT]|uniref:Lrp/AsnC family transcriptional regulator n=1 Tax=Singulisphaera sp. PoT TaxID=3411797 RepID=UPI003BF528AC
MIDEIDRQLLNFLQADARISNAELARRVGMAPSGVLERVKKLEERGLIRGFEARLDARKLGSGLVAFAFVKSDDRVGGIESAQALAAIPEVQEVHHIAGEDCYLIKIRVSDVEALGRLLREKVGVIPTIRSTRTTIVMETLKETATVQIPGSGSPEGGSDAV